MTARTWTCPGVWRTGYPDFVMSTSRLSQRVIWSGFTPDAMRLAVTASANSRRVPVRGSPRAVTLTATESEGWMPSSFQASEEVVFPVSVVRREATAVFIRSGLGSKFVSKEGSSIMATRDFGASAAGRWWRGKRWGVAKRKRVVRSWGKGGQDDRVGMGREWRGRRDMKLLRCRKVGR